MPPTLPATFLFRPAFVIPQVADVPQPRGGGTLGLDAGGLLPPFGELDGTRHHTEVRACWNSEGIGFFFQVKGKRQPLRMFEARPEISDGIQIWLATRPMTNIHRATRFCHHFIVLPKGQRGRPSNSWALQVPIAQARDAGRLADSDDILVDAKVRADGYTLAVWFAGGRVLHGFDPEAHPKLAFFYAVQDAEWGTEALSASENLPVSFDPSLWGTLEFGTG